MRRYQDQMIAIGYHGSGHVVATTVPDGIWDRVDAWYPSYYRNDTTVISRRSIFTINGDTLRGVGWVNGRHPLNPIGGTSLWAQEAVNAADTVLARPPEAFIDLSLTRDHDQVQVKVTVDSLVGRHQRLALRIALVEDTVRIRGGTTRRMHIYVNRLQARAEGYPLGLPISATEPSTTLYRFDLAALQQVLDSGRNVDFVVRSTIGPDVEVGKETIAYTKSTIDRFPDRRDFLMDLNRLHIVAFVQDLETGDILQAVRLKVPPSGTVTARQ